MPVESATNNKRIAKNMVLLYLRMFFVMAIQLYTSRIVLSALGVVDYGIYNVVGGIVTLFAFMNMAMINATQRYITYELGRGDFDALRKVFTTTFQIHIIIAIILILISETIGVWFLFEKMVIPDNRIWAAFWVLQFSIVTTVIAIMSVPYNSAIIAHEKMDVFAVISIFEVVLKLIIVFSLLLYPYDRLIIYALLMTLAQFLIRTIYTIYCNHHFAETHLQKDYDYKLIKEIGSFAGWNILGGVAGTLSTTGLNLLLNVFFGPIVNAARAVAVQVEAAITQFSTNFQMAVDPQITKLYAQKNMAEMHLLLFRSSKFSFFLLFTASLPVLLETDIILSVWLKEVPAYTSQFIRIILCAVVIESMSRPLMTAANATGNIKLYQIVIGGLKLLILPISYFGLLLGCSPESVFWIYLIVICILFFARLKMLQNMIALSVSDYIKNVVLRCSLVTIISIVIPLYMHKSYLQNVPNAIIISLVSIISSILVSYTLGMTANERCMIKHQVVSKYIQIRKLK